jgi:DNA-binding winged helix-turn-helix (wHTH) protein
MPEESKTPSIVRFGPFELSTETGELRKNGIRKKLFGQPIQVLTLLVATPGQLVTREQLQKGLWPGDTFTDFERGLNAAISRLRENLDDSPTDPKYIETIPGRGYRFIGSLEPSNQRPLHPEIVPPTPSRIDSQNYTLVAYIPRVSAVGRAAEVVVWMRYQDFGQLGYDIQQRFPLEPLLGVFYERAFTLEIGLDADGNHLCTDVLLRLEAPNFEPDNQIKKLSVPPNADSPPCTFLVRPSVPGDLVANLEVLLSTNEKVVASRAIRTRVLHLGDDDFRSESFIAFGVLKQAYEDLRIGKLVGSPAVEALERQIPTPAADIPIAALEAETDGFRGQSFTLTESMNVVSIGSSRDCEVCLERQASYVSRLHSKLVIESVYNEAQDQVRYTFILIDCGSRGGTRLNGEPIIRANLRHGDRFELGTVCFRFVVLDGASVPNPSADTSLCSESGLSTFTEQQTRLLEGAAPKEATVGCSMEVLAMVREVGSDGGLRALLLSEKVSELNEGDVRERPFEMEFPVDADGKALPLSISLRLESPGFEPTTQIKKLSVPPTGNSPACTFVVIPRLVGEHVMNLELLDRHEQILVSRSIRTRAVPGGAEIIPDNIIVTIPLLLSVRSTAGGVADMRVISARVSEDHSAESAENLTIENDTADRTNVSGTSNTDDKHILIGPTKVLPDESAGYFGGATPTGNEETKIVRHGGMTYRVPIQKTRPASSTDTGDVKIRGIDRHEKRRGMMFVPTTILAVLVSTIVTVIVIGTLFQTTVWHLPRLRISPQQIKYTLVVGEFSNSTGDPALDGLSPSGTLLHYRVDATSSPELISTEQVTSILTLMNLRPDQQLTPVLAREVCLRANGNAVATGSLSADEAYYKIAVSAVSCQTGQILGTAVGDVKKIAGISTDERQVYVSNALTGVVNQLLSRLVKTSK